MMIIVQARSFRDHRSVVILFFKNKPFSLLILSLFTIFDLLFVYFRPTSDLNSCFSATMRMPGFLQFLPRSMAVYSFCDSVCAAISASNHSRRNGSYEPDRRELVRLSDHALRKSSEVQRGQSLQRIRSLSIPSEVSKAHLKQARERASHFKR